MEHQLNKQINKQSGTTIKQKQTNKQNRTTLKQTETLIEWNNTETNRNTDRMKNQ